MAKFLVQAVKRPGFDSVSRGGRAWPSAAPVEVEVLDQDECPKVDHVVDGKVIRQTLDPKRIGRTAWALVMAEGRLSKTPAGLANVPDPMARIADLEAENAALKAQVAERQTSLATWTAPPEPPPPPPPAEEATVAEETPETDKPNDSTPKARGRAK